MRIASLGVLSVLNTPLDRHYMPGQDYSSFDKMLKDDLNTGLVNSLNEEAGVQSFMTEQLTDESWQGRQKRFPVKLGRNWGMGSIGSRGALPQAKRGKYDEFLITMRDFYGRVAFEEWVIQASKNKKGAYGEVIAQEMDGMIADIAFYRNIVGWGDGRGILAKVSGAHTAQTTIEVKDPGGVTGTTFPNRYLQGNSDGGMFVAFLNPSTFAVEGTGTITAVNTDGTDFTSDTSITCSDGALIVLAQTATQHSYNKEPEGLRAGIDDGTYVATYHNLSRSTYDQMKAYVTTGVGAFSLDAIQQSIDACSIRAGSRKGTTIDLFACEHSVRRAYLALLEADRRYTGADLMSPDGGTSAAKKPTGKTITYGGIPWLVDRDAPYGTLWGIDKSTWVRYVMDEGSWADREGSILKWVDGFDEYTAFWHVFENYHCNAPARNLRMEGITVNQLAVRAF